MAEQSIRDEIAKVAYRAWREAQRGGPIPEIELEALGSRLEEKWMQEVANSILASPVIRRIQTEALRDHAKAVLYWERGHSPRIMSHSVERIVADLHDRADRIERGETA